MIAYFQEDIYSVLLPLSDKALIEKLFEGALDPRGVIYTFEDSPCGTSFYVRIFAQRCTLEEPDMARVLYAIWEFCDFATEYVARDDVIYLNIYKPKERE